jgi:signal transduction histidine kinase
MKLTLRTRILLLTVLPIVTLVFATLATVNRSITHQVQQGIQDDLRRASAVAENVLEARAHALAVAGEVITRDPKFFSVLTIPDVESDRQLRSTVAGVARDFNLLVQTDLFEVMDARGHLLASAGREASDERGRAPLIAKVLAGRPTTGILTTPVAHYQAQAIPVAVGGQMVGILLLGARIDDKLAGDLKDLTRSDVTFVSEAMTTGTTLESDGDGAAALAAVARLGTGTEHSLAHGTVFEVKAPGHVAVTLVHQLPGSDPGQRQLYVMQRSLDAETAFLRTMQTGLVVLGGLALLLSLAAGAFIAQRIISPVRRVVRGAEEMERGNYDFPLEVAGDDEIAYLARRFEDMRGTQREYVASLQELARVKSEFIAVASHELRTPISVIGGFQELMAEGALGPVTADQREGLEAIHYGVQTLTRIAEDATRMAQIEGERLVLSCLEQDLRPLLEEAARSARADAPGRRVTVSVEAGDDLGTASVDGPRLTQAVANLVRNGIRFTPDGGNVTIHARCDEHVLEIAVSDTGVGIPRERQSHVFERGAIVRGSQHHHSSTTLEFNSAGLGLGLSIAGGIIGAHGGTIVLDSEVGRGSTFTIMIPLKREGALPAAA